ncbi:hypothetical protein [Oligoflexus tunisiensis]|uniref:hypothetical protein n=1 Tax=Oligoflexus tunisiensis TaxID=708132 RepID=UPI001C401AD5|nr:hypothetical protein [Oligoflexus tunisiensis]
MRNFQEILQNLKPLISWRSWWPRDKASHEDSQKRKLQDLQARENRRLLTLARPERRSPTEWRPVTDSRLVQDAFHRFRQLMYDCNRRTKQEPGATPRALWEAGKLAGDRAYFFLQPWNDRGYLFEETPRGWVVARAEKIAAQSQFVRDRLAWDHVILHEATDRPGLLRVSSEQMGEGIVSLRLYEDFMSQAFRSEA